MKILKYLCAIVLLATLAFSCTEEDVRPRGGEDDVIVPPPPPPPPPPPVIGG